MTYDFWACAPDEQRPGRLRSAVVLEGDQPCRRRHQVGLCGTGTGALAPGPHRCPAAPYARTQLTVFITEWQRLAKEHFKVSVHDAS